MEKPNTTQTFTVGNYQVRTRSLRWYVKNTKTGEEYPVAGNKALAIEAAKALDEYDKATR